MKPGGRRSDFFHKLLEAAANDTVREEIPGFIGEHKVPLYPAPSSLEPLSILFQPLKPEQLHHGGSQRQDAGLVVLGLGEVELPVLVLFPAKLQNLLCRYTCMTYAYIRVSTRDRNEDRQLVALTNLGISKVNLFLDKQSGKDFNRPAYQKLIKKLKRATF